MGCWTLPTTPAALAMIEPWITAADRRRARIYRDPRRRLATLIGSGLLRWVLAHQPDVPGGADALSSPRNRRPRLRRQSWAGGYALSMSHGGDRVLAGILRGSDRLGVDLESGARHPDSRLVRRLPWPDAVSGTALLQRWCLVEAALKADGRGLAALGKLRLVGRDGPGWRFTCGPWTIRSALLHGLGGHPAPIGAVAVARLTAPVAGTAGG